VARWAASGLTPAQVAKLDAVQYQITVLGGGVLGLTGLGETLVRLDATAAGYGWFVDPTPSPATAFGRVVAPSEVQAAPGSLAFGRMDLLTVVEHELGHVLGLGDLDPLAVPHDLLTETLAPGVRRSPEPLFAVVAAAETPAAQPPGSAPATLDLNPSLLIGSGAAPVTAPPPATSGLDPSLLIGSGLVRANGAFAAATLGPALGLGAPPLSLTGPSAAVGLGAASPLALAPPSGTAAGSWLAVIPAKPDPGVDLAVLDQLFSSPDLFAVPAGV
jgi:hypothetical protein